MRHLAMLLLCIAMPAFATNNQPPPEPPKRHHHAGDDNKDLAAGVLLGALAVGLVWHFDKKKDKVEFTVQTREQK